MAFSRAARSCGSKPSLLAAGCTGCVAQLGSPFVEAALWHIFPVPRRANSPKPAGFRVLDVPSAPCLPLLAATEYGLIEFPGVDDGVGDGVLGCITLPSGLEDGRSAVRV
jgi:hypothetical protein